MAVTVTVRMADGITNPVTEKTAAHILVAGLTPNATDGTPNRFRIVADAPGAADNGQSVEFSSDSVGGWEWDNYVFPISGAWALKVYSLNADGTLNAVLKNQAVTVDAAS